MPAADPAGVLRATTQSALFSTEPLLLKELTTGCTFGR
jgi:hypothetical protein